VQIREYFFFTKFTCTQSWIISKWARIIRKVW